MAHAHAVNQRGIPGDWQLPKRFPGRWSGTCQETLTAAPLRGVARSPEFAEARTAQGSRDARNRREIRGNKRKLKSKGIVCV